MTPARRAAVASLLDAIFGVDARALAALRIGLAALTLVDLALRAPDVAAFYTDAVVLPRSVAQALAPSGTVSIYLLAGGGTAMWPTFLALLGSNLLWAQILIRRAGA